MIPVFAAAEKNTKNAAANKTDPLSFLLSALLICLSFPKWNLEFLAWFALVPMLWYSQGLSFKKTFLIGWFTGTTAFFSILYWIIPTFQAAEVSLWIGILALLLLASYLGLYYGLFLAIQGKYSQHLSEPLYAAAFIALWVALEYVRSHLFTGFPWALLGYSQWKFYPAAQIAEWTGVYGVSAMIVASNFVIWRWIKNRKIQWGTLLPLAVLLLLNVVLGFPDSSRPQHRDGNDNQKISIAILQGNIDQYKKWSQQYVQEILDTYAGLCKELNKSDAGVPANLVIWPETSVPGWIPNDPSLMKWIQKTIQPTNTAHLVGAVTHSGFNNYNSAFLFAPDGKIIDRYDKIHLVPFGEFVPFQSFLGRWIPVLNQLGGFNSGIDREVLQTDKFFFGVNVCYESTFPHLVRRQTKKGAEFLVNITNDGWYLDTAAPEQHFSMNVFRAIENRRTVVRAANTGISGIIEPSGRVVLRTELNQKALVIEKIMPSRQQTFYSRFGDVFAWLCCGIAMGFIIIKKG